MTETVLLALDTSTEFCSVALLCVDDGAPGGASSLSGAPEAEPREPSRARIWLRHEATGAVSSTRLLPAIVELFDEAARALADCDAIAFGAGPGSFTGLRTATGVAQGLAFGLDIPVVPLGTLLVCAEHARWRDPAVTRVLAALDARMDEVYWADYAWDAAANAWRTLHPASLGAPEQVGASMRPDRPLPPGQSLQPGQPLQSGEAWQPGQPFTLAGNAARAFGSRLSAAAHASVIDGEALPHALPLAHAGLRALRAGRVVRADQALPEYVRDKVAQTTAERLAAKAARQVVGQVGQIARAGPVESAGSTESADLAGTIGQFAGSVSAPTGSVDTSVGVACTPAGSVGTSVGAACTPAGSVDTSVGAVGKSAGSSAQSLPQPLSPAATRGAQ